MINLQQFLSITTNPILSQYPQVFQKFEPDSQKETLVRERLNHLDTVLDGLPYLASKHVTVADLSVAASLSVLEHVNYDFSPWKNLARWRDGIVNLGYYAECNKGFEDWKFAVHFRDHGD